MTLLKLVAMLRGIGNPSGSLKVRAIASALSGLGMPRFFTCGRIALLICRARCVPRSLFITIGKQHDGLQSLARACPETGHDGVSHPINPQGM
jgi:hypothetical protein